MRLLPYSKALLERRAAGGRPWLVVVTIGNEADRRLMRMGAFAGDPEVARIWVPDDFRIEGADLRWAVGLDVLVAPYCEASRVTEAMLNLWRARPATLWQLDAGFTATRLDLWRGVRGAMEIVVHFPVRAVLDQTFRATVERTRDLALLCADAPLFDQPAFDSARLVRTRQLSVAA